MKKRTAVKPNIVSSKFGGKIVPKEAAKSNSNNKSKINIVEKPITFTLFNVLPNFCEASYLKRSLLVIVSQTQLINRYQNIES